MQSSDIASPDTAEQHRRGEKGNIPQRSSRIFFEQGNWYFRTREGAKVGPFHNERAAGSAVNDFIAFLRLSGPELLENYLTTLRAKH